MADIKQQHADPKQNWVKVQMGENFSRVATGRSWTSSALGFICVS